MICQVADPGMLTPCPETESGGLQCEVLGEHTVHEVSAHTIRHATIGNGWRCSAIAEPPPALPKPKTDHPCQDSDCRKCWHEIRKD